MARHVIPSFAKGELSPALYGRVDTAAYAIGLATARNVVVHTYGGVSKRPGGRFIGPVADHTYTPQLLNFKFKTSDQYVLEFGNLYMRVIRDGGYVLDTSTGGTITGVSAATPPVITLGTHGFSTGDEVYFTGVGGATRLNGNRYYITVLTADTFSLQDQVTGDDIVNAGGELGTFTSGGTCNRIYEIVTPYANTDLTELKYTQSADVMTLTHQDYPVYKLSRLDHDDWTLEEATFGPTVDTPPDMVLTVDGANNGVTYKYRVTAIDRETEEESLPGLNNTEYTISGATQASPVVITSTGHGLANGDEIQIDNVVGMTELNGNRYYVANKAANTFELTDIDGADIDGTGFTAYSSAGIARRTFVQTAAGSTNPDNTITWTAVTGADRYSVYRLDNGIYGFIGETELATFKDSNIDADTTITHPKYRNPFAAVDDYPGAVGFYEQRQVYGGSVNEPDTSEFSQTARYDNFNRSQPQQADDSITATLASTEVNEIRHYVGINDLIVLTSGSEWRISAGPDQSFSWDTIRQKPQSMYGCSHIRPALMGSTILFITDDLAVLRALGYSFELDGYKSNDMTLYSSHLTRGYSIVDMAASTSPDGRLYMPRSDGDLLTFSFDAEQEVNAWTHWDTDGEFERVVRVSHGGDNSEDQIFAVVRRIINGNIVRYIEEFSDRFFEQVQDCFFIDSGLSLDEAQAITTITLATDLVTVTGHGYTDGDIVEFQNLEWVPDTDTYGNLVQPDQLNTHRYIVDNATTDTFTLLDYDDGVTAIDFSAFNDYVRGGVVRKAYDTVSGLDHLEGEVIVALCDGNVVKNLTVTNGAVSLGAFYCRVHAGMPYIADIQTLPLEAGQGTIQGMPAKISRMTMRFYRSRGMFYGPDEDHLDEMKQRELEAYGDPTSLLTGDKEVNMPPQWQTAGCKIWLRHIDPLPMTLLAIFPDVELGDN